MLKGQLNWCGKLPSYPDFIQSHTDTTLESIFMRWIEEGQNHIGKPFLNTREIQTPYFYIFTLHSLQSKVGDDIYGVLFLSSDERGRSCPFVAFTRDAEYFHQHFLQDFEKQMLVLNFNVSQLNKALDSKNVIESFKTTINSLALQSDFFTSTDANDHWIQCYPSYDPLILEVAALTSIVYRKLILR